MTRNAHNLAIKWQFLADKFTRTDTYYVEAETRYANSTSEAYFHVVVATSLDIRLQRCIAKCQKININIRAPEYNFVKMT